MNGWRQIGTSLYKNVEKKTGNIATKIAEEAKLRAIMVEQEYSTNCSSSAARSSLLRLN